MLFQNLYTETSTQRKMVAKPELEKKLPLWKNIRVLVYYLQGVRDDIVDASNAGFARQQLINAPSLEIIFLNGRKHLLAQYEWPAIRQGMLNTYEKAARK